MRSVLAPIRMLVVVLALLGASCAPPGGTDSARAACPGAAAAAAPARPPEGEEPDFALYGFPQVAASLRFTPGQPVTLRAGSITIDLPADMYTEPLEFELLVGDERPWQGCVAAGEIVIAPYAYRVTDPATRQRIGRFDKPVTAVFTDPRIREPARYWITNPTNPATAQVSSNTPAVRGTTATVTNSGARVGWFTTVPRPASLAPPPARPVILAPVAMCVSPLLPCSP